MPEIEIEFRWSRDGSDDQTETNNFDVCIGLLNDIDNYVEEQTDALNADLDDDEDEWEFEGWSLIYWDDDYGNPNDFDDLDEYADFAEKVEEHGVAYLLRYEDVGEFDFHDEYNGEWDSEEDFVQQMYSDCYDIPAYLENYIDWGALTDDVMMDYSSYTDNRGRLHIFRN